MNKEHFERAKEEFTVSTDKSLLNIELIHQFLSKDSYWAQNIPLATVEKSIENSVCFGLYLEQQQIGFARVVTDKATFAYLADVFIVENYRGKGLSKWLMESVHYHPELQDLRRWLLATKDAHELYRQFNWTNFTPEQVERLMQKHNPGVYKKAD